MARIQVVIDEAEREQFRACARAAGMSLSEWLRELGRGQVAIAGSKRLVTRRDLVEFFDEIKRDHATDAREEDWEVIKARLDAERFDDADPLGIDS